MKIALLACAMLATGFAHAAAPKHKDLSKSQVKALQLHQRSQRPAALPPLSLPPARPYSEVEDAGYFFLSADGDFNSAEAKKTMIANLPAGVTAVVFVDPGTNKSSIINRYKSVIDESRLKVIELDNASYGFWARDGLPIAVWSQKAGEIEFVDSKYYHGFEPDKELGKMFNAPVNRNNYYFEGGNFMTNDLGDCITVDNDLSADMPDSVFKDAFGCKRTVRLPFTKGIGHIDESVRFIRSNVVVSDDEAYAETLRKAGFQVEMLPRPERQYETYVNAMLVNGTIFVPVYDEAKDAEAIRVYESLGLKVVPIVTNDLSNDGLGSLHCITMSYPKVPFNALISRLGAREL